MKTNFNDPKIQQKLGNLINSKMRLCWCGSRSEFPLILKLLERAEKRNESYKDSISYYEYLYCISGNIIKWFVVEVFAKVLDSWGLLEHGTGIGWAWLTDDGQMLIDFLREYGTQESRDDGSELWPDWSYVG